MLTMIKYEYGIFEIKCCNMLHFVNYQQFFRRWDVQFFPDASQEFLQRGTAVLGSNFSELVSRLRQIFRCLWQMNGIVAVVVEMFWIVFFRSFPGRGDGCFSLIQEWKVLGSQKILWVACWNQIYWDYFSTLKRNLYRWMNHMSFHLQVWKEQKVWNVSKICEKKPSRTSKS